MPSKISDIVIKMEDVGMKIDGSLHRENEENIGEISRRGRRQPQSFSRPSRTTRTENQSSACGNRKAAIQGEGEEEEEVTQKARTIKRKSTKLWASKEESEGGWRDNLENGRSFSMQMAGRYGYDSGSSRGKSNDGRYEKESKKMKMDSSTSFLSIESDGNLLLDDETEQLKDEVEEKKKLISSLKSRPWRMSKKLKCWK